MPQLLLLTLICPIITPRLSISGGFFLLVCVFMCMCVLRVYVYVFIQFMWTESVDNFHQVPRWVLTKWPRFKRTWPISLKVVGGCRCRGGGARSLASTSCLLWLDHLLLYLLHWSIYLPACLPVRLPTYLSTLLQTTWERWKCSYITHHPQSSPHLSL